MKEIDPLVLALSSLAQYAEANDMSELAIKVHEARMTLFGEARQRRDNVISFLRR